jgi:hypothetical protein
MGVGWQFTPLTGPVAVRVVLELEFGGLLMRVLLGQAGSALAVGGVVPDHPAVIAVAAAHIEPSHHDPRCHHSNLCSLKPL